MVKRTSGDAPDISDAFATTNPTGSNPVGVSGGIGISDLINIVALLVERLGFHHSADFAGFHAAARANPNEPTEQSDTGSTG